MFKKTIILTAILLLAGCVQTQQAVDQLSGLGAIEQKQTADKALARIKCIEICQNVVAEGLELKDGPCLSNSVIPDWVCDIAHSPRIEADNEPANQCPDFAAGKAHHFVEVDGNCNLIQVY